jgi:hypothetical protein
LAAAIGYYSAKLDVGILLAGLVTGFAFVVAAGCSFYSARPIDFNYPGNDPVNWYGSLSDPLSESMGIEAENYSAAIADNEAILNDNAKWLMAAFWAAAIAPIAGVAVFLIANLFCRA